MENFETNSLKTKKPELKVEKNSLDIGILGTLQQGVNSSNETTGVYDSKFIPQTSEAKKNTFQSKATEQTSFVSLESGVRQNKIISKI